MHIACKNQQDNSDLVKAILEKDPELINIKTDKDTIKGHNKTPVHYAESHFNFAIADYLRTYSTI